jgi:hypothetical protein
MTLSPVEWIIFMVPRADPRVNELVDAGGNDLPPMPSIRRL